MVCSKFHIEVDEKEALWFFLNQILAWHTGRNEENRFNTLRVSTSEHDLYWDSHVKESIGSFNIKLVCSISMPYKLNSNEHTFDHRMFIEGKKENGRIIWKQSSYDYLKEVIEDLIENNNYEVKEFDFDGSTSESWGIYRDYHGIFIYQYSQYYGK